MLHRAGATDARTNYSWSALVIGYAAAGKVFTGEYSAKKKEKRPGGVYWTRIAVRARSQTRSNTLQIAK